MLPFTLSGQNIPACDSVYIDCCNFDLTENTITLTAENQSSVLFSYPGFVILDASNDTIAKETVNYFGIGPFPQLHVLEIIKSPELPFTGTLELHSLFYDILNCVFEITIPDTALTTEQTTQHDQIWIFPNPTKEFVWIRSGDMPSTPINITLMDSQYNIYKKMNLPPSSKYMHQIDVSALHQGIYYLRIESAKRVIVQKLIKH